MIRTEFGTWWFVHDRLRYWRRFVDAVAVPSKFVDHLFGDIFDHCKAACHIAIKRRVPGSHLGFVACGEDDPPEFVGDRHHDVAADAGLDVFLGCVGCSVLEHVGKHAFERNVGRFNRNAPKRNTQPVGEVLRVDEAAF